MLKNLLIVLSALVAMSLSQWLLMSFISRNAGVATLGAFTFSLSAIMPLIALLGMGFRWLIITEPDYGARLKVLVSARAILLLTICPVVLIVLGTSLADPGIMIMAFPILAAKIAEALSDICYGKAQRDNRFGLHGLSVFLRVGLAAALFYWAFIATGSVPVGLLAIAAAWFVVLFGFDLPSARAPSLRGIALFGEAVRFIGPAIRKGWPLSVSSGVGAVALGMSNYTLMYYWGAEDVGYYAAFFSFVVILNLGAIAFGQAALPVLTRQYRAGQARAFLLTLAIPLVGLSLGVCAVSVGFRYFAEPIVALLFGAQVAERASILPAFILFCTPVVLSQFMQYVLTSTASYHYLLGASLLSLVTTIAASLLLVPTGGITGAMHVLFAMGATHVVVSLSILTVLLRRQVAQVGASGPDAIR